MAGEITAQQLIDAATDTNTIAAVANGSATINGTGLVPSRTGGNVKTLQKVISDLASVDIGTSAAALINAKVNRQYVAFYGAIVVDNEAQTVSYPKMAYSRNGSAVVTIDPVTYSLTAFACGLSNGSGIFFHYIDTTAIGTSNPIKSVVGSSTPAVAETMIPLGVSVSYRFSCLYNGDVVYTTRPLSPRVAVLAGTVYVDRAGALGGGAAIYVPLDKFYVDIPEARIVSTQLTPLNTPSSELATHAKFTLNSSTPNATTIFYDIATNLYVKTVAGGSPSLPEGTDNGFLPVCSVWGASGASSYYGLKVQEYAYSDAVIDARLNRYMVSTTGPIVVNKAGGYVRYPVLKLLRNGVTIATIDPATYTLSGFDCTLSTVVGNTYFHYIDTKVIGASNPVKTATANTVPALAESVVPLGMSCNGSFQSLFDSDVVYTNSPSAVAHGAPSVPIFVDRAGRLGGGPALYVPISAYYFNIPQEKFAGSITPTNTASTELAGYAKFVLDSASPVLNTVYLNRSTSTLVQATHPTLPEGTGSPFIPIVEVRGSVAFSPLGFPVLEYDASALQDRLYPLAINFNLPVIFDLENLYGGGAAAYIPQRLLLEYNNVVRKNALMMTESTELAGYAKIAAPTEALTAASAIFFDATDNTYKWNAFVASNLDLLPNKLGNIYLIAQLWGPAPFAVQCAFGHRTSRENVRKNLCPYGKAADSMPILFTSTTIGDVTEANLLARGFLRGAVSASLKRPFFGMPFPGQFPNRTALFRCYVQTDTDNDFDTPSVYVWFRDGTFVLTQMVRERTLSARAAMYSLRYLVPNRSDLDFFYIGCNVSAPGANTVVTGVQFHLSDDQVDMMLFDDYPDPVSIVLEPELVSRDATNMARARALMEQAVTTVQRPTAQYDVLITYGQSFARGNQTSPPLSKVNKYNNKTLGANALPTQNDGSIYPPFGGTNTLTDLTARSVDGATIYSYGSEPTDAAGEPPNIGWINNAKFLHNQAALAENDTARTFVTFNASVGGKTIEQLSKVNTQDATNRYGRFTDGIARTKAAAGASTCVVTGFLWMQGEYNYSDNGGSWDKATYKTLFTTMAGNLSADAIAATSQTLPPAIFMAQAGMSWTRDVDSAGAPGLHIGQAQLELGMELKNVWLVGPTYQYPDKASHLSSNSSRWFGNMVAKVYDRVVRQGRNWRPLSPTRITRHDDITILIDFHVPVPPLKFDLPYVVNVATDYAAKGFRVTDSVGTVAVQSVDIVGSTIVRLRLAAKPVGATFVWYASKTTYNGNGCLRDSDPSVGSDVYEYTAGMDVTENLVELVGKPYPLQNWCVAFYLPVGYAEA